MRVYHGILLVAVLTIGMVSAGVAWERFCLSPPIDEPPIAPDARTIVSDELPPECLEELSSMGQPKAETAIAARATPALSAQPSREAVVRSGGAVNQVATHIEVAETSPSLTAHEAGPRPIQRAQSADYVEVTAQSTADVQQGRPRSPIPNFPEKSTQKGSHDKAKSVDAFDLMRRLRAEDADQRADARRELVRRGFSEVDLELARQLFSPDVETRKQLARAVPRLASVNAEQWLMWLAQDPEPDVRLAAISTLATTGDPELLDRVAALAGSDHDPQIKALEQQIRKQRDLESNRGGPIDK